MTFTKQLKTVYKSLIRFFRQSLAQSTISTYSSAARSFYSFCFAAGLPTLPTNELNLCLYVTHSAQHLSCRSIKVYLCGIRYHSLLHGHRLEFSGMSYLYHTIRGIRRSQGNSFQRPLRAPITIQHLLTMLDFLSGSVLEDHDKAMWRSLVLSAFFGLLRVSEFTTSSHCSCRFKTTNMAADNLALYTSARTIRGRNDSPQLTRVSS